MTGVLEVFILRGENLAVVGDGGKKRRFVQSPAIELRLGRQKQRTRRLKGRGDGQPTWGEEFHFRVQNRYEEVLRMQVTEKKVLTTKLGSQAVVPLQGLDVGESSGEFPVDVGGVGRVWVTMRMLPVAVGVSGGGRRRRRPRQRRPSSAGSTGGHSGYDSAASGYTSAGSVGSGGGYDSDDVRQPAVGYGYPTEGYHAYPHHSHHDLPPVAYSAGAYNQGQVYEQYPAAAPTYDTPLPPRTPLYNELPPPDYSYYGVPPSAQAAPPVYIDVGPTPYGALGPPIVA